MAQAFSKAYTPAENELTYLLLTELLAHQFCSPVQWIDTQDVFLGEFSAERIVELGPGETLVNMARKTVKAAYTSHDSAKGIQREFLSYKKNADSIYYDVHAAIEAPSQRQQTTQHPPSSSPPGHAPVSSSTPAASAPPVEAVAHVPVTVDIPDQPPSPADNLVALIALALKKETEDIHQDQTIKKLCGGRSTLQNEIIGDLTKEFGSLPDQPEDMSIADVSNALSSARPGLGPCTNARVAKFVSTKLPAGVGAASLRQYLESRWSFRQGLQDRVLLYAICRQPASRFAGQGDMESFLDNMVGLVLKDLNIDPRSLSEKRSQASASVDAAVISEALDALQRKNQSQDRSILEAYAKRCNYDMTESTVLEQQKQETIDQLQSRIDQFEAELGDTYEKGIQSKFDAKQARKFDSYWNWVIEDLVATFANLVNADSLANVNNDLAAQLARFQTRATPRLLQVADYLIQYLETLPEGQQKETARAWLHAVRQACEPANSDDEPHFKFTAVSNVPILKVDDKGTIAIEEVSRDQGWDPYLAFSVKNVDRAPSPRIGDDIATGLASASISSTPELGGPPAAKLLPVDSWASSIMSSSSSSRTDSPLVASTTPATTISRAATFFLDSPKSFWAPEVKTKGHAGWRRNHELTHAYLQWFKEASTNGFTMADASVLVTGAGQRSIGADIVKFLLSAGAKVLVTTSSFTTDSLAFYQELYHQHAARRSELIVVPFNGGSQRDTENLVRYIYDNLGWDLDHVIPFAAVGETGRAVDKIDAQSELAHRVMLTNVIRLLGAVKAAKEARQIVTHPTHVVLPLSPNHGIFGQDGLYAESKIGLEALLNKWWSEDWSDFLTLCGAVIGWTRGTGLMAKNDILAARLEKDVGIRTFSTTEIAWHIMGLIDGKMSKGCDLQPLMVDLSGGMQAETNLRETLDQIRDNTNKEIELKKAIARELAAETTAEMGPARSHMPQKKLDKKARLQVGEWSLPSYNEIRPLASQLEGMVDLDRVVVVTGFGEIGPCGSARTRWEAECSGTFSIEGCVELAWIMGLVRYHNGTLQGKNYCGWLDVETKAPIADAEIKAKYESYMIENTGIRLVQRQNHDNSDPNEQLLLHEVSITEDLEPFEVSLETAEDFKREHGDKVIITKSADGQQLMARLKRGATLWIPKAAKAGLAIGSQLPRGWDPRTYGISDDIISQVDPVTLHAIVSTVDALLSAGITDPFELYKHIHVSDLGNAIGASLGGLKSMNAMFRQRFLDRRVQKDILAETFANTPAAWVNMLLLGSSGPIRTPVGACATALESVDNGYDLIITGKAKAVLVGGTDSLERDIAREFANMQATIDAEADRAAGRVPKEASRPMASSRAGFVEGEGCGIQLLTTARLAIDMGLPVYGIVSLTHTASDNIGRSLPAPGKGVLSIAADRRPTPVASPPILLDLGYRRQQLARRRQEIEEKRALEHQRLDTELEMQRSASTQMGDSFIRANPHNAISTSTNEYEHECRRRINGEADRLLKEALNTYGNVFWQGGSGSGDDDFGRISPLRGALAVWGLTIDDLGVASLHGTSTVKNDLNETDVLQRELVQLGRTRGNVLPCVCQKSLLGHGKGAAGAFALNGCLQMLNTGIVPGNRNADNIDAALADRDLLLFPSRTMRAAGGDIKAFSVTSFGFGQKGAQVVGVHPRYLYATLSKGEYESYQSRARARMARADRFFQDALYGGQLVNVKEKGAYADGDLEETLLTRW